ncbi:MAG TPA: GNAT family N-acetyltransferase [Anaerolineae bacterium]|nr:GNAT family N-acetyltransferase [Anaerolineae bacterium]
MNVVVRPYRRTDRPRLEQTIDVVCAEGMMRTSRFEPTPTWLHALEVLDCPCHLLLVASKGERVVGWCRLFPAGGCEELELGIGVLGAYRRQGVGKALLSTALEWADGRGTEIVLRTRLDNHSAIHLFNHHCGFRATNRGNGLLTMRRSSGPWSRGRERRS